MCSDNNFFQPAQQILSNVQVKTSTSKGPPQSSPPSSQDEQLNREESTPLPLYCSTVLEFSTHLNIELEQLPVLDILPPTPVCQQADCRFEIGPLCFVQDLQHYSGG